MTRSTIRLVSSSNATCAKNMGRETDREDFERLLEWLDPDREKAGEKYEWIRRRLIKMFVCRGSHIAEELADRTIDRVSCKLPEIRGAYSGEPAHYFGAVAKYILHETLRKDRVPAVTPPPPSPADEFNELSYIYLEDAISKLPAAERDLIIAYYQQDKRAKIDHRKKLAKQLGMGMNALRIRACRIRASLEKHLEACRSASEEGQIAP
jgi:hypothetical protein